MMEDNAEMIRKYEKTIKCLTQQLKTACQERDEARHQIKVLLRKLQPCSPQDTNKKSSIMSTKHCSDHMSYKSCTSHCDLSLASDRTLEADYVAPSRDVNMVDKLVCGKPLPPKGRLLRTVTEAGPLLHTLLAPLPQWRNPPPFDNDNGKTDDVIPTTSLSLAFHVNSRMSSPSLDVNPGIVHLNHNFTGKKRRVL
ncbi:hypothetical protein K1719_032250 [Acacia pycnantha]|nr:hypothetical protein K1719_032250 [Acacia pycnantha]